MNQIGVGFFVGAGVPRGPRVNTFVECDCCGAYHRTDFNGDCREDSERHRDLPDDAEIVYADDDSNEWSGACDPCDPANYWIDDETGERVSATTGERTEHDCPMLNADGSLKDEYDN